MKALNSRPALTANGIGSALTRAGYPKRRVSGGGSHGLPWQYAAGWICQREDDSFRVEFFGSTSRRTNPKLDARTTNEIQAVLAGRWDVTRVAPTVIQVVSHRREAARAS